jgi:hypothetical protein
VNIGPTAVDFSMLARTPLPASESKNLAAWKKSDFAAYSHQNARRHWRTG